MYTSPTIYTYIRPIYSQRHKPYLPIHNYIPYLYTLTYTPLNSFALPKHKYIHPTWTKKHEPTTAWRTLQGALHTLQKDLYSRKKSPTQKSRPMNLPYTHLLEPYMNTQEHFRLQKKPIFTKKSPTQKSRPMIVLSTRTGAIHEPIRAIRTPKSPLHNPKKNPYS